MQHLALIAILIQTMVVLSVFDFWIWASNQTYTGKEKESDSDSLVYPRTIMLNPLSLVNAQKDFQSGNNIQLRVDIKDLISEADSFLDKNATSVTDKKQLPPSGDKHDFLSLAPFRWPDPTKKNGLPYIALDSSINPEIYSISDKKNMDDMTHMVTILSAAYYFTNDSKYASKAEEILRVWFLDKSTKMDPHLRYAEMVRGKTNSYAGGIMAGRNLTDIIDSIGLIQHSPVWTSEDKAGMALWFTKYLNWLLNSTSGRLESQKMNNHGTYYYLQVAHIALFLNKTSIARSIFDSFVQHPNISTFIVPELSIRNKIQPDGRQLFELQRSKALAYSMFNLLGIYKLANIAENVGVDIWNYKVGEDPLLQKALDFLLPYIMKEDVWPYSQATKINRDIALDLLCHASVHYPQRIELYSQALSSLGANTSFIDIDNLQLCVP